LLSIASTCSTCLLHYCKSKKYAKRYIAYRLHSYTKVIQTTNVQILLLQSTKTSGPPISDLVSSCANHLLKQRICSLLSICHSSQTTKGSTV
jgi:hypothetical protein